MVSGIDSARLKLVWAAKHLDAIKASINTYSARHPYEIVTEPNGEETLNVIEDPPTDIAILAGEMVYQIRSALDHLVFDLIKLNHNGIILPDDWVKRCEFPLWSNPKGCKPPLTYSHFSRVLPGISAQAFTFIESLQPYYRRDRGTANYLWLLAELSNIDKHRYLNLTVARIAHDQTIEIGSQRVASRNTIQDGAQVESLFSPEEMARAVNVDRTFSASVSFKEWKIGMERALPVEPILESCLNIAEGVIVPAFEKFIKKP